ncbi:MAG: SRPBCC family protein [Acidobacteriaceae bacterium]
MLEASVVVHRPPDVVWAYLGRVENVASWDRGVARTEVTTPTASGVGLEFDTLAHPRSSDTSGEWGKMSYRTTKADPATGCTVQLTSTTGNARFFRSAEWRFRVEPAPEGSTVFCAAAFTLRRRYLILAPVFLGMKRAIRRDLEQLREKIEAVPA